MKYSNEKATELQRIYNIPDSRLAVWKYRKTIPDKYRNELPVKITNEHELQQVRNLITAIKTRKLKGLPISRLAGLSNSYSLNDTLREKSILSQQNLIALKKAVNTIRNQTKKILNELEHNNITDRVIEGIKKLFKRKEIAWFVVLGRNRKERNKFDGWIRNRRPFPIESLDYLKGCLVVFLIETALS